MAEWYYEEDGQRKGPFSREDLKFFVQMSLIQSETRVTKDGEESRPAREFPELFAKDVPAETAKPPAGEGSVRRTQKIWEQEAISENKTIVDEEELSRYHAYRRARFAKIAGISLFFLLLTAISAVKIVQILTSPVETLPAPTVSETDVQKPASANSGIPSGNVSPDVEILEKGVGSIRSSGGGIERAVDDWRHAGNK